MKSKITWVILALAVVVLLGACAPSAQQAPTAESVCCTGKVDGVFLVRAGADHIVVIPMISFSNPNPHEVKISDVVYRIDTGVGMVIYDQFPGCHYIPAGETVTLPGTGYLSWGELVAEQAGKGVTMPVAVGTALPYWKAVGGKTPAGITADQWKAIEAKAVTYSYEVSLYTSADGTDKFCTLKGAVK